MTTKATIDAKNVDEIANVWNTNNPDKIAETFAEDATFQDSQLPTAIKGKHAIKAYFAQQNVAFPDSKITVQNTLVQGAQAASTGTWTGTNKGPLPTPDGKSIPATNKKVGGEWAAFVTFNDSGKIKSFKLYSDNLTVFQQLGLAPQ